MFEYELDAENHKKIPFGSSREGSEHVNSRASFDDHSDNDLLGATSLSNENLDKVKTRQKREPQPKLDANRLLQPNGLMYIKEKGPKLKFKGKGQEFEDLRHLLDFYQLWCHQLFPKMRFPDAIKKIEKLCSERRLKVFREELIKAERESRGIASGVQIQIDNNRPDTITDWNFGDHEEVDAPMVIQSDEETPNRVADVEDGLQFTGSNGDIEADQLRRIRENRERALARLAARKRARTIEREEEEEEARKIQRAEEVSDLPNSELHETEPEEQESVE